MCLSRAGQMYAQFFFEASCGKFVKGRVRTPRTVFTCCSCLLRQSCNEDLFAFYHLHGQHVNPSYSLPSTVPGR